MNSIFVYLKSEYVVELSYHFKKRGVTEKLNK